MFERLIKLTRTNSFFLFGARGTGKSTLLKEQFDHKKSLWIDLLDSQVFDEFIENPNKLYGIVKALPKEITHVIIDEIQKVPILLNEVHRLIEETDKIFALTGSSARKLRRGGANLLAGRAFMYHLYSLSCFELKERFDLDNALQWGTLPKMFSFQDSKDKEAFLYAYVDTYLKEEIVAEQTVRKLQQFRKFLEVAAQCNGKLINYSKISEDVHVDEKTVKEYFCILEDTLIGFFLEPFHTSIRKRLSQKPKFYFFDTGIVRTLTRSLTVPLRPKTTAYGNAFEHFCLLEFMRLGRYLHPEYRFSFLNVPNSVEVDLIVERPSQPLLAIEIKSSDSVTERGIGAFRRLTKELPNCEAIVLCQERFARKSDHIMIYPWKQGLEAVFPEISQLN